MIKKLDQLRLMLAILSRNY